MRRNNYHGKTEFLIFAKARFRLRDFDKYPLMRDESMILPSLTNYPWY